MFTIVKILYATCKHSGGKVGLQVYDNNNARMVKATSIPTEATIKKARISDTGRLFSLIESYSINLTLIELKKLLHIDIELKIPILTSTIDPLMNC